MHTVSIDQSEVIESRQQKVLTNGWMGEGSKSLRIPSCSTTPPVSPNNRRRSLGVLRTPAWSLRMYRDPNKTEFSPRSPSSTRRRSLVLPLPHVPGESSPCFLRRKPLVSPDVSELTTPKVSMNLSKSAEELDNSCDERLDLQVGNTTQSEDNHGFDSEPREMKTDSEEEFQDFRPRLRSRSLDDSCTQARKNVLQNLIERPQNPPRKDRRKSFEVWLTGKEQETIRKLQMLTLEKQRATEEEAKRKEQRKGKTYEEWLDDKNNMAVVKDAGSSFKNEGMSKEERQLIAKRRYEKWLMEKETLDLEKEREMLEEAKLKTIEMRKKYEEKKKKRIKVLISSPF
ncbi:uncharacterized protein LOC114517372 [Dendronephthya gigantea]|uniref:uncharacterized protein LOC114517372 n=1 Tax=Dendronephthya gigantea TaxID=151771 RepID=UPI00106B7ED1|nr:uncharacterized protein LOC114517372 [Dendronephthya gigantea]